MKYKDMPEDEKEKIRNKNRERWRLNKSDYHDLVKHDYETQLSTNDAKIAQLKEKGIEL